MSDEDKKLISFEEFEEKWNDMVRFGDDQDVDTLEVVKQLVLVPMFQENCGKVSNFKFVTTKGHIELLPGELVTKEEVPETTFAFYKRILLGFFNGKK